MHPTFDGLAATDTLLTGEQTEGATGGSNHGHPVFPPPPPLQVVRPSWWFVPPLVLI